MASNPAQSLPIASLSVREQNVIRYVAGYVRVPTTIQIYTHWKNIVGHGYSRLIEVVCAK